MADKEVVAAGAVITRYVDGVKQYLLIHRGYRDDWTFPKGKLDSGEHVVAAAVREVREETGFAIRLGQPLPSQHYEIPGGIKVAHYWVAEYLSGTFVPNDEVDELQWLPFNKAASLLSYKRDLQVLKGARDAQPTIPFIVLRHTQAMKRSDWQIKGETRSTVDAFRPLTAIGRTQAVHLIPALAAYGINAIHSSDSYRCRDTVGPYATARSLSITPEPTMSEERHAKKPKSVATRIKKIAVNKHAVVLCTHRPVMPTVMSTLFECFVSDSSDESDFDPSLAPGSMVIFHRDASDLTRVISIERHVH